jgi:hypothetical protein
MHSEAQTTMKAAMSKLPSTPAHIGANVHPEELESQTTCILRLLIHSLPLPLQPFLPLSLSLSLTHKHIHTHTHILYYQVLTFQPL